MRVRGSFFNIIDTENNYEENTFYEEAVFFEKISKLHPKNMQKKGEELFDYFIKEGNTQDFEDLKEAFFNLYRIFSYYFEGESTGLLKSVAYREGSMKLEENLKLPELIVQGVLKKMMQFFNKRGVLVKNTVEKDKKNLFAVYEVTWMRSNVGS